MVSLFLEVADHLASFTLGVLAVKDSVPVEIGKKEIDNASGSEFASDFRKQIWLFFQQLSVNQNMLQYGKQYKRSILS